jgi:LmbE family N-acetylglucosaminyl deacetylase
MNMLNVKLNIEENRVLTVLCLGAHSDDIEIGCGGTILKLIEDYENTAFYWVVFSSNKVRKKEAEKSAQAFLQEAKQKQVIIKDFRDGFLPYLGAEIKEYFEELKQSVSPDLILTHHRFDLHQDHRLISDLTWNTFRDHLLFEYEIPKYDGDLGVPNFFVPIKKAICTRKIKYILNYFRSQRENQWFSKDTFQSLLRLRGIESNAPEKYAEAYYCRKINF